MDLVALSEERVTQEDTVRRRASQPVPGIHAPVDELHSIVTTPGVGQSLSVHQGPGPSRDLAQHVLGDFAPGGRLPDHISAREGGVGPLVKLRGDPFYELVIRQV